VLALLAVALLAEPGSTQERVDTLALESHARFLAADLLQGRAPASQGERIAALYIATRLAGLGLQPLPGLKHYRLPVPLTAVEVVEDRAVVRVTDGERTRTLQPPAFYHPGGSRSAFRDFSGDLLFAGPVPGALEALAGHADLTGKVVVLTPPWSRAFEVEEELWGRGAAGAVELVPNGEFYERLRIVRGPTRYHLPDAVQDPANQSRLPRVVGGPVLISALGLDGEAAPGRTNETARSLERHFELELPYTTERRTGYNVVGQVPGADPALREEWIVYVAHYDHVGIGEPADGDSIWNGFVDNAVGAAMLLQIAAAFASDPPARSVAFLWVTAEEQGLLGSNWFVDESPIPVERIRAVVNLDGGAPPAPPTSWGLVGADDSAAGRMARGVIERHGWSVEAVEIGPQSDHWPFHGAGVSVLLLFPGSELEGMSAGEAQELIDRWVRPHSPHDEWSADFPLSGLARYAELALEIGRALAR
jgi:hypothetical protein